MAGILSCADHGGPFQNGLLSIQVCCNGVCRGRGAVTGDPFVEIVAQARVVWAGRVLGPGREGASIRKVVTTDRSGIVRPSFPT